MVVPQFTTNFGGVLCRLLGIITRVAIYYGAGNDYEPKRIVSNDGYSNKMRYTAYASNSIPDSSRTQVHLNACKRRVKLGVGAHELAFCRQEHSSGCQLPQIRVCAQGISTPPPHSKSTTKHPSAMTPHTLPLFALLATCLALFIPPQSQFLQLTSLNSTLPSSPTITRLGTWPHVPFSQHFAYDTDLQILSRTPSPATDPTSEMDVLSSISIITGKARHKSRLSSIQDFNGISGAVTFRFHGTEDLFSGPEIAGILDAIWTMTNRYGKSGIYGSLVREGLPIAHFELEIRGVAGGK